jgi:hypothetical protein
MDDEKRKLIEKLENASYSNERTTFLDKDMSNLQFRRLYLTNINFIRCNFCVSKFYRL